MRRGHVFLHSRYIFSYLYTGIFLHFLLPPRTVADVRVVGLGQQRDDGRALVGRAQQQEAQVQHRGAAHVVRHVS